MLEAYEAYKIAAAPALRAYLVQISCACAVRLNSPKAQLRARTIVIEFPSLQVAQDCYNSATYQAAKALRDSGLDRGSGHCRRI